MTEPWSAGDQCYTADPSFTWENVPWTLLFNSGPPHQGYFETWNGYTLASTTLELFTGGVTTRHLSTKSGQGHSGWQLNRVRLCPNPAARLRPA